MSKTLCWAMALGILLAFAWLAANWMRTPEVASTVSGSGGTLSPGGQPYRSETTTSAKANAAALVACAFMKSDRIDEACEVIEMINKQERSEACNYAFTQFINDRIDVFNDDTPTEPAQVERLLRQIHMAHQLAERSSDPDLRATMLVALARHRGRIPDANSTPTKMSLLEQAKQSLSQPSIVIPTGSPWYWVLLTGIYGAITSAVGWKLLEAGSSESGKWIVQNFVLPSKAEAVKDADISNTASKSLPNVPSTPAA